MIGIKAWNRPNHKPQIKAMRQENFLVVKPLQMETEKASMDRPTAISNSSIKLILIELRGKNSTFLPYKLIKTIFLQFVGLSHSGSRKKSTNKGCRGTTALQTDYKI